MENLPYELYRNAWNGVLSDGVAYNHWGGKAISSKVISLLELQPSHSVLDVCCGEGGTLRALPPVRFKCGIDISFPAIERCRSRRMDGAWVQADAHRLPFESNSFDRIFSQDADAWLQGDAISVLREVARVMKRDGIFVFQNYVQSREMPEDAIVKTESVLRSSGFAHTELLIREELDSLFRNASLDIKETRDLHDWYLADNIRMLKAASSLQRIQHSLLPLLAWRGRYLFQQTLVDRRNARGAFRTAGKAEPKFL